MSSQPYEIIAGPADVYVAAVGASFPGVDKADTDGSFSTWTHLGFTDGGVKVKHTQTVDLHKVDQRTGPVKATRSEEGLEITFSLAEPTLENYAVALNDNDVSTDVTPSRKTLKLYRGLDVAQFAVLVRGPSPYMDAFCQYQVPVCVQTEEPEAEFIRDGKAVLATKFVALEDPNAATADDRFGSLVAQTS